MIQSFELDDTWKEIRTGTKASLKVALVDLLTQKLPLDLHEHVNALVGIFALLVAEGITF